MEKKTKLTKNEYLESLDPDNLNLEKSDLINFCHGCIEEWKKNKLGNSRGCYENCLEKNSDLVL